MMRKRYFELLLLSLLMTTVSSFWLTQKISASMSETNKMPENLVYEQLFRKINNLETQANQPFYDIFDVDTFKFALPEINAVKQNKLSSSGEISEQTAYEQLFRIIISFEKRAEKLENEGSRQRAEFLRNFFRRKSGLTSEQSDALKTYAKSFTSEIGEIKNRYESARQSKTESLFQSENFERERTRLFLDYHNRLKRFLGENGFENFAKFVQEKVASRLTYRQDVQSNRLLLSMSMVEYNEASDEVLGYSFTNEPGGHDSIWNIVHATLTSDSQGIVDSDSDEQCDQAAEVFLFASGTDAEETFCVDGLHEYAIDRIEWLTGRPKNPPAKAVNQANYGGCYGYEETDELPPSEDCLTTPQLPNVTGVNFELIQTGNTTIDTNPNLGGGQRIFPDDDTPGDTVNRQLIRVRAQISENRAGLRVYFGNYDLDDPSTDMIIDPNGNAGDDNNGEVGGNRAGQLIPVSAVTNSNGVATVNFTVTRQPGDNFAIAASTTQTEIASITVNGTDLTGGSGTIQTNCDETDAVCRTEMLTVWRRLHIEVDSMGESTQNFVLGNFTSGRILRRTEQATINVNTSNPLEVNRFENGRVTFGGDSLRVVSNGANAITVENTSPRIVSVPIGGQFQLFDDDDFNDNDGTNLDGDTGEDIPMLQRTYLEDSDDPALNRFAPTYIRPKYDIGDNNNATIFASNVATDDAPGKRDLFDFDHRDTEASQDFWTVYLLSGYQHITARDEDPESEASILGTVDREPDPQGIRRGQGGIVFFETNGPKECPENPPFPTQDITCDINSTKIHEIGHLFGAEHGQGGVMDDLSRDFSPTSINVIRGRNYP